MADRRRRTGPVKRSDRRTSEKASTQSSRRKSSSAGKSRTRSKNTRAGTTRKNSTARNRRRRKAKKGFGSWSVGKKIAAILGGTLVILLTAGIGLLASKMGKIETTTLDTSALNISEEVEYNETGYLNVALFGLDARDEDPEMGSRSDTIMIASLNRETKEVKIVSVFRDTLLQQSDGTYNKANAAYSFGGAEEAVAMLNKNLDMDIKHYVAVDFAAMVDVIDAIGGIDIDVQEEEIPYINGYAVEIIENTGIDTWAVEQAGLQTLTGVQATAYARIRYTAGDDYRRTERQREVVEKIVQKAQGSNLTTINKIIDRVFSKIETNFTMTEILAYAKDALKYKLGEMGGFPYEKTADTLSGVGSTVIPLTLESNVIELHRFFFGEDGYSPSSMVRIISGDIEYKSTDVDTSSSGSDTYYYDNTTGNDTSGTSTTPIYTDPNTGTGTGYNGEGTGGTNTDGTGGTGGTGDNTSGTTDGSNTGGTGDVPGGTENYDGSQY